MIDITWATGRPMVIVKPEIVREPRDDEINPATGKLEPSSPLMFTVCSLRPATQKDMDKWRLQT